MIKKAGGSDVSGLFSVNTRFIGIRSNFFGGAVFCKVWGDF